jgi:hypothetical protein
VRALVSGLAEPWRSRRLMVMFQAFIDDSGWDGRSPVFVLAGYVATENQWEAFSDEWQTILDLEEPKKLGPFKMAQASQFRHRTSPFYGFTPEQLHTRLRKLGVAINKHVEHGIISVVPIEPYRKVFTGRFHPDALDRPYFLSFYGVMTRLIGLTKQREISDGIDFIFDTQGGESIALLTAEYQRFLALSPQDLLGIAPANPKFENDEKVRPLQAADMIAWLARRYYHDLALGRRPEENEFHEYLANLFKPEHDFLDMWTEKKLEQAAALLLPRRTVSYGMQPISMTIPDPSNPLSRK